MNISQSGSGYGYGSGSGDSSGSRYGSGSGSGSGSVDEESSESSRFPDSAIFRREFVMVVSEYLVTYTVRDCGVGVGALSGYYDVFFASPFTFPVDTQQVCDQGAAGSG